LVKKTVNQDDTSAYHLFYADGLASPGTDITFFDWPVGRERRGTNSISRTGLRVGSMGSLQWWKARFAEMKVACGDVREVGGRQTLDFEDGEGQRFRLTARRIPGRRAPSRPNIRSRVSARSPSAFPTSATPKPCWWR
jgi:glyoxalase family protein